MSPGETNEQTIEQTTMEDRATQPLGCWKAEFRNKINYMHGKKKGFHKTLRGGVKRFHKILFARLRFTE